MEPVATKRCGWCKKELSVKAFSPAKSRKDGLDYWCKVCHNEYRRTHRNKERDRQASRERYQRNRAAILEKSRQSYLENPRKKRDEKLRREYGLGLLEWETLFEQQGQCCAICKTTTAGGPDGKSWATDHNHETNKIRGILCFPCNTVLGLVKENQETLAGMQMYLAKEKSSAG